MGDEREVHDLLDGVGAQHRKAGLAASHDVAVVAEDVERVICERTRADMEHRGGEFARDLVHIGDHQQQTLAGGEGGRQSACAQRAVHRAGCAGFGLHFSDLEGLTEDVLGTRVRPFVGVFRHRRGRRDGIYRCDFTQSVCYVSRGGIAVYSHFFAHL